MEEAYEDTKNRERRLKGLGYNVVVKWGCEVKNEMQFDPVMKRTIEAMTIPWPLDAREGLFGGRTNATKLYHKCGPGEIIRYGDFTSLYPYICKVGYCRGTVCITVGVL